ncbi:glycosyltransferase family 9 protein [Acidobacteriota bacterium]
MQSNDSARRETPLNFRQGEAPRVLFLLFKSIGDAILATPCFETVKRNNPAARVEVLANKMICPVLAGNPDIDRLIPFKRTLTGKLRTAAILANSGRGKTGYSLVIDMHGGSTAALLSRVTRCARRAGYENYRFNRIYTHRCPQPIRQPGQSTMHTAEYRLFMLDWLGFKVPAGINPKIYASSQGREEARRLLAYRGDSRYRYAVIHPGAALQSKRWPPDHFKAVAGHLWDSHKLRTVAVGGSFEADLVKVLAGESSDFILPLSDPPLETLIGIIAGAQFFLGNDSGPGHIAAALSVPSVVIFTSSNQTAWRPLSEQSMVVSAGVPCSPCPGYTCHETNKLRCVSEVAVSQVIEAVERVLSGG